MAKRFHSLPGIIDAHAASDSGVGAWVKVRLCCQTDGTVPAGTGLEGLSESESLLYTGNKKGGCLLVMLTQKTSPGRRMRFGGVLTHGEREEEGRRGCECCDHGTEVREPSLERKSR